MDLTYTQDKMFTRLYPNTDAGVEAWNVMAAEQGGVAAVLNQHAASAIYQLKKAGYSVGKQKAVKMSDDELLTALGV